MEPALDGTLWWIGSYCTDVMVLHKDQVTTLATASVATMMFALGLAYLGMSLKGQEVLACVPAYAAVLVVFVGTNS